MKKFIKNFLIIICFFMMSFAANAQVPNVASLSFTWSDPVSMAVFERDEYIWIVFNRRKTFDVKELEKSLRIFNPQILSIPHSKATVLRLKLQEGVKPSVRKEGLLWIVDFIEEGNPTPNIKELQTQIKRDGLDRPFVFIENNSFAEPISIIDPEIGDVIVVEPAIESSVGVLSSFHFVDFTLLKSQQGLAIVPRSDDVIVIRSNDGASIKNLRQGLSVSDNVETMQRLSLLNEQNELGDVFELKLPPALLAQPFLTAKAFLENDIKETKGKIRAKARFQLAKFYVAKAMGIEAIGILNQMIKENELNEAQKQQIFALRGAANFLARRYDQALEDFSYGALAKSFEVDFWNRIIEASINPIEYNKSFSQDAVVIKEYPIDLQIKIAEVAAQASINARDDLGAQNFIDILKISAEKNPVLMPKLLYLTAQNLYLQGYPRDSLDRFKDIIDSPFAEYSAYARYAAAILSYEIKAAKIDETIEQLEKIKFAWSQRRFKIRVLKSLAELYSQKHDYNNAIAAMIEEYELVSDEVKPIIRQEIITELENLYIENQADETPPLKALSLYKEHLDIIKESKRYVDIAISVADRYFAVDLADNAKVLLIDLLKSEDIPEEQKYKIGTRLALIYLYQELYSFAIDALDNTQILMADVSLENQRDVIRASAYKEMGEYDKALKLLDHNYSNLATLLKSEIYWLNEDYESLSLELKYLIEEPVDGKELSDEQIKYILDWMMALKKAKKEIVLARARAKFLPWFENTKYYSTFDILTSQFGHDKVDMNDIANRIKNIEIFSDFNKKIAENLKNVAKSGGNK